MFKKFVGLGLLTVVAGTVVYTVAKRVKKDETNEEVLETQDELLVEEEPECGCCVECEHKDEVCTEDELEVSKENNIE